MGRSSRLPVLEWESLDQLSFINVLQAELGDSVGLAKHVYWVRRGASRKLVMELGGVSRRQWDQLVEYCNWLGISYEPKRGRLGRPSRAIMEEVARIADGPPTVDQLINIADKNGVELESVWSAYQEANRT